MSDSTQRFGDRYSVIGRAGSGGMAEVYRARDELLGREVALKVLSQRLSADSTFVERFRREAQAAANLNHPNVVSLFDYGSDRGTYYIVMEYIDGRSLSDIVRAEGPYMPERAAEISADVAAALERAHQAGLVHRDIKPSNIMINSQGQTKVTDFGIARAMATDGEQTMTQTGMVIGTAAYLSPEQAQGNPVDARSDVYSLGCVLYELLTARAPFSGETPLSIAYKHVRENATPPSSVNPDVPAALDAIVMKAMAKNPDNRYQSAAEFREDLERFLSGQKVAATPLMAGTGVIRQQGTAVLSETQEPVPPEKRRRTGLIVFLVLLGLGLLALLGFLLANALLGNKVDVPDLTGKTRDEALVILQDQGLKAKFVERASDEPVGTVFDQDPQPGDEIDEGGEVTAFVSSGPKQTTVPDLVGSTEDEAKKELKKASLELDDVTKAFSSDFEEGQIIEQNPPAGADVDVDSTVDVVISRGPELVTVTDVTGQTEEQASANLGAQGFDVSVEEQPDPETAEGLVISQDPAGGEQVDPTEVTSVTIVVSTGPETFELPDVTGDDKESARSQLEDLGLVVQESEQECGELPNRVCDTDPGPGSEVAEGDTVTLLVQPAGPPSP